MIRRTGNMQQFTCFFYCESFLCMAFLYRTIQMALSYLR